MTIFNGKIDIIFCGICGWRTNDIGKYNNKPCPRCENKSPKTIVDAVIEILKARNIENLKYEDPAAFHHSTGRWLRNRWALWDTESPLHKEFNSIGIFHPDDMSGIILETAHRITNGHSPELSLQVSHYKEYWSKIGCDMKGNRLKNEG